MILLLAAAPLGLLTLLIYVVVGLIILGLLWWAVTRLSAAFGIPEPIKTVIIVILVIFCVIAVLYALLGNMPIR
jgi:hypothetical protein